MSTYFKNIDYLKTGTERQQQAFKEITEYQILEKLKQYHPILVGTIPIGIDIPDSDLDIICECKDHVAFRHHLMQEFSGFKDFKMDSKNLYNVESSIAEFKTKHFEIEIFGQNIPTEKQHAYRHMLIEKQILDERGEDFRRKIVELKSKGMKTEPAFAELLGLSGNPYLELLKLERN